MSRRLASIGNVTGVSTESIESARTHVAPFRLSPSRLARYFFHECERHLVFAATPASLRKPRNVPAPPSESSPITRAILDGGYAWEERVITEHLSGQAGHGARAHVARGDGPLRERAHTAAATLALLRELAPGHAIYQGTLTAPARFYARYGLDPAQIEIATCRPDLLLQTDARRVRVVDVKASEALKASHRVQVALYALLLRDLAGEHGFEVDLDQGGVWLHGAGSPELFDLSLTTGVLEAFLRERLPAILEAGADKAGWHLHYRCEWCEWYPHCREEAFRTRDVSLLPYLSTGARAFFREASWGGPPVDTLASLQTFLAREDADAHLDTCGSLRGQRDRLARAVRALDSGEPELHGGSTVALPVFEHVRLLLTVQREPISGKSYAFGLRLMLHEKARAVLGDKATEIFLAPTEADCAATRRAFLERIHHVLRAVHDHNAKSAWADQLSVQSYVFDGYERELFQRALLQALDEPDTAHLALALFFHFHDTRLAGSSSHANPTVPYPLVVLTSVIRELVALPAPLALRLPEVHDALGAYPDYDYEPFELLSFELSNALRSDGIFRAWNGKPEALQWVERELKARLTAADSVLAGLRKRLDGRLFAWPPKLVLTGPTTFQHPELSRLAFVAYYESFTRALATREQRTRPLPERVRDGVTIPLRCVAPGRFVPDDCEVDEGSVPDGPNGALLSPPTEEGERAQMGYDDFRYREAWYSPADKEGHPWLRIASVTNVTTTASGAVTEIELDIKVPSGAQPFRKGDRLRLHPRTWDLNTKKVIANLRDLDEEDDPPLLQLLRDTRAFSAHHPFPRTIADSAVRFLGGLTDSQSRAFQSLLRRRMTLVWGPPGTGKTHFLTAALRALLSAHAAQNKPFRVALVAFTHAAIENALSKLRDLDEALALYKIGELKHPIAGVHLLTKDSAANLAAPRAVVGMTVFGTDGALRKGMAPYDLLVVDEASQMRIADLALALNALSPSGRLLLAGDDLQLPPILAGEYPPHPDGLPGLEDSAFAYLRARDDDASPYTSQLLECFRMNAELCAFPAQHLYGDRFRPATDEIARRRLRLQPRKTAGHELLDPDEPLTVRVLDGPRASTENLEEAALVADLALELRERLLAENGKLYPDTEAGDRAFWRHGLFIVCPHHAQIRAIQRALSERRAWKSKPFVDTVDKMQGQEADAVIVSYGVSDPETAQREAAFIYGAERLNVSVTRARRKCVVLLQKGLLEPSFEILGDERAARGLGMMVGLAGALAPRG
ncbi:MAG: AAA family ATPase [Myxococcales bacterium]|nr:AAA family ATPase [Myxococcales bacterium]